MWHCRVQWFVSQWSTWRDLGDATVTRYGHKICTNVRDMRSLVGLRTGLMREMAFTLCLKMFLDHFFSEESHGADHFLKKRCPTCPFAVDINNIFSIKNQQSKMAVKISKFCFMSLKWPSLFLIIIGQFHFKFNKCH